MKVLMKNINEKRRRKNGINEDKIYIKFVKKFIKNTFEVLYTSIQFYALKWV